MFPTLRAFSSGFKPMTIRAICRSKNPTAGIAVDRCRPMLSLLAKQFSH